MLEFEARCENIAKKFLDARSPSLTLEQEYEELG